MAYGRLYEYDPSLVAAGLFAGLFAVSTALHVYQLSRWRTWYFIPFIIGCAFEVIGYVARATSIDDESKMGAHRNPFIIQSVLILLAPAMFAASIYMMLSRLVVLVEAEALTLIKPRWITTIFVTGDVISFMTQGAGGGMLGSADNDESKADLGQNLIIGGLFVQLVVFGFFIVLTALFHRKIARRPTNKSAVINVPWWRYIYVLYAASILIMVRSIFRAVEYIQGRGEYLQTHEVYFYVFDTMLMFFVCVLLNVFHPSAIISQRTKEQWELNSEDRERQPARVLC